MRVIIPLTIGFIFVLISGRAAAKESCRELFRIPDAVTGSQDRARPAPAEILYTGADGSERYIEDGIIWKRINNYWVRIGTGTYSNGVVYEDRQGSGTMGGNSATKIRNGLIDPTDALRTSTASAGANSLQRPDRETTAPQISNGGNHPLLRAQGLPDLRPLKLFQFHDRRVDGEHFFPNVNRVLPSEIYSVRFGQVGFDVVIPKGEGYGYMAALGIIKALKELPLARLEALRLIRLNTQENVSDPYWRQRYSGFTESAATAADGVIDIYKSAVSIFTQGNSAAITFSRHEFGHLLASLIFGTLDPDAHYEARASADGASVSTYGDNSLAEDFAEAVEAYLRSNAGQLEPELRKRLSHRFDFLDDVFSYRSYRTPQSLPQELAPSGEGRARRRLEILVARISRNEILAIAPSIGVGVLIPIEWSG